LFDGVSAPRAGSTGIGRVHRAFFLGILHFSSGQSAYGPLFLVSQHIPQPDIFLIQ
jgi:hypothetical protein